MKLLKKVFILTLVMCFILPLCACGKSLPNEISQEDWNSHRQYVKLSTGITMSYVEMGDPDGEIIVLQHGMTDNSRSWSLTAPYFARAGYHIYMPDLRGQGKSDETDGYYTTFTYATDLSAFFDAMKINKAIVVGHSLGSYTAQNFWLMFPEKCSKIVLVSSLPLKGYQNTIISNKMIGEILPILGTENEDAFMDVWYSGSCKEEKFAGELFDTFIENMKQEAQALSKKSWENIFKGLLVSNIESAYTLFDKTISALILHGDDDEMAKGSDVNKSKADYQMELCDLLKNQEGTNITYKSYANVGHNIQFEIPEEFATDVLSWLSSGTL